VQDFITVEQEVTGASVEFKDEAIADFFEDQVDAGRMPEEFARIFIHTHPSGLATSSGTDEKTFYNSFGKCNWAIMFILPKDTETPAAWLQFNIGPKSRSTIETKIDFSKPFPGVDIEAWDKEYNKNIQECYVTSYGYDGWDDYDMYLGGRSHHGLGYRFQPKNKYPLDEWWYNHFRDKKEAAQEEAIEQLYQSLYNHAEPKFRSPMSPWWYNDFFELSTENKNKTIDDLVSITCSEIMESEDTNIREVSEEELETIEDIEDLTGDEILEQLGYERAR